MSKGGTAKLGFEALLLEPSPGGFVLNEPAADVYKSLSDRFSMTRIALPKHVLTLHDTFDGRLFRRGVELWASRQGRSWELVLRRTNPVSVECLLITKRPGFADELPPSPTRDELLAISKIRRLLPFAELEVRGELWCVLDDEQKIVARWLVEENRAREAGVSEQQALPTVLRCIPVRGYDARSVVAFLEKHLGRRLGPLSNFCRTLAALDKSPGDQAPKLRIELSPAARADEAVRAIGRRLLAIVEANEEGTRRDLDTEFLHDFRVALRRTRSLLGQLKKVFQPEILAPLSAELKWLGSVTGPTRDLDVFRLKLPRYRLPAHVRDDLDPLVEFLATEQRREQRRMARQLRGQRYRRLLADWRGFLEVSGSAASAAAGAEAERPIAELAAEKIWRAYRRVRRRGLRIDDETPLSALHDLRIDCKKLRYLLELFRGLFDPAEMTTSIKALKALQDHLGDLNDLAVQQGQLQAHAEKMLESSRASVGTIMAMGRLQGLFEEDERTERRRFAERFGDFARSDNHRRYKRLFKTASSVTSS